MNFTWFTYQFAGSELLLSAESVRQHLAEPDDRYIVWEEEKRPLSEEHRRKLLAQGVVIRQRRGMHNLNGSKENVELVVECLANSDLDGSGEVWKIDCDTLCLGRKWRDMITPDIDMIVPINNKHEYGFCRFIRTRLLQSLLDNSDKWQDWVEKKVGWPEDIVIAREAKLAGFNVVGVDYDSWGTWAGWSYRYNATLERYACFDMITFGNRQALVGTREQMHDIMIDTMRDNLAFRQEQLTTGT